MDFDNPKVYGNTSISDGLVLNFELPTCKSNILSKMASSLSELFSQPNYLTYLITHKLTGLLGMGTFISQIRHCAQVLVPATVYSCLAAVFDIFEIGSLQ